MHASADKIMERGDVLEEVARKAKEIEDAGEDFKKISIPLKKKAKWQNIKVTFCLCCACTSSLTAPFFFISLEEEDSNVGTKVSKAKKIKICIKRITIICSVCLCCALPSIPVLSFLSKQN